MTKALLRIAAESAWNRRGTLGLVVFSLALSVVLLLGVEQLRNTARTSFEQSVSGVDLIVGARTSPVQLLLYSVFRLGSGVQSMQWQSFQAIASHRAVAWAIPISLGDSHHRFPVLGTTSTYFERFQYGDRKHLELGAGKPFAGLFEAMLGSDVARTLGYRIGDRIVLEHGSHAGGREHADKPFVVVGILVPTGSPVDRTIHITLEALEAIHLEWQGGTLLPGLSIPAEHVTKFDLTPKEITAALVALKNRADALDFQTFVNGFKDEPLLAILPGVALSELWAITGKIETILLAISGLVFAVAVLGLVAVLLAGLGERRRELAILRSVGAGPLVVLGLLAVEGLLVVTAGVAAGVVCVLAAIAIAQPAITSQLGVAIPAFQLSQHALVVLSILMLAGFFVSLFPGVRAYRLALADGLSPRL
jgi:putative ABC transport system permease protein